jgi:hypothetical protein
MTGILTIIQRTHWVGQKHLNPLHIFPFFNISDALKFSSSA